MEAGEPREKWDRKPISELIKGLAEIIKKQEQAAPAVNQACTPIAKVHAAGLPSWTTSMSETSG